MKKILFFTVFINLCLYSLQGQSIAQALKDCMYDEHSHSLYLGKQNIDSWDGLVALAARYPDTRYLYLDNNQLGSLTIDDMYALRAFTVLRGLMLDCNCIRTFPPELALLETLEALFVEHNELEQVPVYISSLPQLRFVSLRYNNIADSTNIPGKLGSLQEIDLRNNPLCHARMSIGCATVDRPATASERMISLWNSLFD